MAGNSAASNKTIVPFLVCFAVKEEAKYFVPAANGRTEILITGMGQKNAKEGVERALNQFQPGTVITAGFAGGLNPALHLGAVVFDADPDSAVAERLTQAGAVPARFFCADHVAVTVAEKQALAKSTGADAVEMESSTIRTLCQARGIPSATVRVISDAADEDLPLDFNALMSPDYRINFVKLARTVALAPEKIPQLMRFQKQTAAGAQNLAKVLRAALSISPP